LLSLSELNGADPDASVARAATYITPVQQLRARIEAQRGAYVQAQGEDAYLWAVQHARTLQHSVLQSALSGTQRSNKRDEFMAENVGWVLDHEGPGAKMALWAHNAHLMRENGSFTPLGANLKQAYGDAFYMFRLAFNQGEFLARLYPVGGPIQELQTFRVDPAPAEALEASLARVGFPLLALDLRGSPTEGAAAQYLNQQVPMREIGAAYTPGYPYLTKLRPRVAFDGVLFVETTTASRPNPPLPP
jgi:erythromycin esterase